jgi:hypothetical protein
MIRWTDAERVLRDRGRSCAMAVAAGPLPSHREACQWKT